MNPELINEIINSLLDILPENWLEIKVRLNTNENFFEMFFYVKVKNQWIYCFDLPKSYDISMDEIDDIIDELSDEYFNGDVAEYSSATIHCLNDGEFQISYEYGERLNFETWKEQNIN